MSTEPEKHLKLWQILVGGFALVSAAAGGTWALRADRVADLQSRLNACEGANEVGWPELVKSLGAAATDLDDHLKTMKAREELESRLADQITQTEQMAQELEQLRSENQNLNEKIARLGVETLDFTLLRGRSQEFRGGSVVVGFSEADVNRKCRFLVNNAEHHLDAGGFVEVESAGKSCKVILRTCVFSTAVPAEFRLLCR